MSPTRHNSQLPEPITDPVASAKTAGLRYVSDTQPGITRVRRGHGFVYWTPDRTRVTDRVILDRIRALAIPPAWTRVWICPIAHGHFQGQRPPTRADHRALPIAAGPRALSFSRSGRHRAHARVG